jgi:CubicO group peptidase (beta-lactamase class C family)
MNLYARVAPLALIAGLLVSCSRVQAPVPALSSPWPAATPSRVGLAPKPLTDMLERIRLSGLEFRSLVIVKDGKLAASVGFDPFEPDTPQNVYSCTKSFLSTLVGIASAEGLFPPLDAKIAEYLPDYDYGDDDSDPRRRITFAHLLSQSSGFPAVYSWDFERVVDTEAYIIHKGLVAEPGAAFLYNSGTLNIVSAALQKAVGMKTSEYAKARLFAPLGIRDWAWSGDGAGVTTGGTNLCLSCLDLAKLGYLYLRKGDWFGKRVLPSEWVERATQARFKPSGMNRAEDCGYGYLWWIDDWGGFSSHGSAGQFCFVLPAEDLVVAFTSSLPAEKFPIPYDLMKECVLPALRAGRGAPPDPVGDAAFAALAASFAARARPVAALPPAAASIAGKRFVCGKNPLGMKWFSLDFPEAGSARIAIMSEGDEKPLRFNASLGARLALRLAEGGGIAARGEWAGDGSFGLLVFDMRARMDFAVDFDGAGGASVKASSPAYGIDAAWKAVAQ